MKTLPIKFEQLAFCTSNPQTLIDNLNVQLGLDGSGWTHDEVITRGVVNGRDQSYTKANLFFHYGAGIELEVLEYVSGHNWLKDKNKLDIPNNFAFSPKPSHIGMHVDEKQMEEWKDRMAFYGIEIAQEVFTINHTNNFLVETGRKYHYVIFNTEASLGFDFKLIRRIEKATEL